jgi:proteic killer suppression protein
LRRLYEDDDRREVNPQHADKIARVLARLDAATRPEQLDLPGFRLHPLKGELAGYWSITVRANWRIISALRRATPRMLTWSITIRDQDA